MARELIRIERIRLPNIDSDEYRFSLIQYPDIVVTDTVTRQEFQGIPEEVIARIADRFSTKLSVAIQTACKRELIDLHRNTGVLDNTATEHRPDPRAASPRLMTAEEYGNSIAIPSPRGTHIFSGAEFQNLLNQQSRAAMHSRAIFGHHEPDKEHKKKERASKAILMKKIGCKKYKQLIKRGYFEETGKSGLFRFHLDKSGGVTFIQTIQCGSKKTRQVEWSLCIQSSDSNLPKYDIILSRWMSWKANEDEFLNTANFRNVNTLDEAVAAGNRIGAGIGGMLSSSIFSGIFGTYR